MKGAVSEPTWREIGLVAVGLACLGALQIVLADAGYLFHSHFWVDELFTYAIVSDPDLPHAMEALANVVDTNPPILHLFLRLWTGLLGSQSEEVFRSFALLSMFLALLGIYLVLRDVFPPLPALTGVLAVWCHPLILRHAFESRFYGPWLAGLAWYAYVLARALRAPRQGGWWAALAATSMFVCTIHYFGILALGLVTLFELWVHRPWSKRFIPCLAALALGPVALAACTPFFLGQRAALSIGTWNAPPDLLGSLGGLYPLVIVFCLYYLRGLLSRHLPDGSDVTGPLGLLSLSMLPSVLILFSLVVQAATMARYILPAMAALAPLGAFLSLVLPRGGRYALCLVLALVGAFGLHELADLYRKRDRHTNELITAIRALPKDIPVAFELVNSLYVVAHYAPDLRARCFFLDFERPQLPQASNHRIITRDVARQVRRFGGTTGLLSWARFQTLDARYVVPGEDLGEPVHNANQRFPGFVLHQRQAGLYELTPAGQGD